MSLFSLTLSYVRRRPLQTALNVLLLALGLATIVVLLLFGAQARGTLERNAEGIDAVVGAKGSPLQLVLSSVYHLDVPTGNIAVREAQRVEQNRFVAQAIPLALGDSYRGHRIVGTTRAYPDHYGATLAAGAWWQATYEAVVGADVAAQHDLALGATLISAHGVTRGGPEHAEKPLVVAGLLAPTGTVLDRLVLTSIETVWAVHGDHAESAHEEDAHEGDAHEENAHEEGAHEGDAHEDAHDDEVHGGDAPPTTGAARTPPPRSGMQQQRPGPPGGPPGGGQAAGDRAYTALLVQYTSPFAAARFPRFVNTRTPLMAASPANEITRLFSLLGVGLDALRAFAGILIVAAALGLFVALYTALQERRYDLAMMRTLGASRGMLFGHVLLEGVLFATAGLALGLALGHAATGLLGAAFGEAQQIALTGWTWVPAEAWLAALALGVGVLAALVPALQAYRTGLATTLARA